MPVPPLEHPIHFPGGVLILESHGHGGQLLWWIKALALAGLSFGTMSQSLPLRDIVIRQRMRGRELYGEGPYEGGVEVEREIKRIVAEVESGGLAEFLRKRQVASASLGPFSESSGTLTLREQTSFFADTLRGSVSFWKRRSGR
jgi:hypothetical protein